MAKKSPTERTLAELRKRGMICGIVERWIETPKGFVTRRGQFVKGIRKDLFGIIDIVALDPERGVIGVQSTGTGFSQHHKDLTTITEKRWACIHWLETPGTHLELWGWRKVKRNGRMVYEPRIKVYKLEDFLDSALGVASVESAIASSGDPFEGM